MAPTPSLEGQLDELLAATEALSQAVQSASLKRVQPLLQERAHSLQRLVRDKDHVAWTREHQDKLQQISQLGEELRVRLTGIRAVLSERIEEVRAARRAQEALRPRRPARGRRLNVKI